MDKIKEMLLNIWAQMQLNIPKMLAAIAIIIIGIIVAKIIRKVLYKILNKLNINKLATKLNEIELISKSNFEIKFDKIISNVFYYIFVMMTVMTASSYLDIEAISKIISDIIAYLPLLISAAIILISGLLVANFLKNIIESTLKSMGISSAKLIASAVFYFIFVSVLMSALTQAKIDITILNSNLSIIIGGGALAFAIGYGFASKDVFSNHLTSMSIKDKFAIGDIIQIENVKGEIILLDTNSVVLKGEEADISFPLKVLTQEKIILFK